jgi:ribosomal protein L11 methylase PrmA
MSAVTDGSTGVVGASFRDPSGFIFETGGRLYRQINKSFAEQFDGFVSGGLYERLRTDGLIIAHADCPTGSVPSPAPEIAHRIIEPERIPFISYPYEWCFSQLKDAAQLTLSIQSIALEHGYSLRDASAYNIQFHGGRPVLIDTLSFERYKDGEPWVAYRQFCQHFLGPLALIAHSDVRLATLGRDYIDGTPLDLCSRLLPKRTRLSPGLLMHIHMHARAQRRFAGKTAVRARRVSLLALKGLVDNLTSTVRSLSWKPAGTEWGDYYDATNYTDAAMQEKAAIVEDFIGKIRPAKVWDLGANTGVFSRLASARGIPTVSFDIDPAAVEKNYLGARHNQETHILPLVMDLTNPSPALGWNHDERSSLADRGPADLVLALALVHHLAISNNVPLERVARFFARLGRTLVIEFVPKGDSQVTRLLATREDIFPEYEPVSFERAFSRHFDILDTRRVQDSQRTLYLMRRRHDGAGGVAA